MTFVLSAMLMMACNESEDSPCTGVTCNPGFSPVVVGDECFCTGQGSNFRNCDFTLQWGGFNNVMWETENMTVLFDGRDAFDLTATYESQPMGSQLNLRVQTDDGSDVAKDDEFDLTDETGGMVAEICAVPPNDPFTCFAQVISGILRVTDIQYPDYVKGTFEFFITDFAMTDTAITANGNFTYEDRF